MSAPDAPAIAAALQARAHPGVAVHAFDTLGSTNAWLAAGDGRRLAAPALCVTDHQTDGAARRGRRWQTLPGNLTFSLLQNLVAPGSGAGALSLVTAIAAADALQSETGVPIRIKWPNDLYIGNSKLGGLLIEARHEHAKRLRLVGGIGINLVDDARLDAFAATTLSRHGVAAERRDALLVSVAAAVFEAWRRFEQHGWAPFAAHWQRLDTLRDRRITVYAGAVAASEAYSGTACGVAADGSLRVRTTDGTRQLHAGEVSVRADSDA